MHTSLLFYCETYYVKYHACLAGIWCFQLEMQSHMAIEIFKKMKKIGCQADSATYNIMIDCCGILRCYKSASLLVSMMIREGFYPMTCTYTTLIKVLPV